MDTAAGGCAVGVAVGVAAAVSCDGAGGRVPPSCAAAGGVVMFVVITSAESHGAEYTSTNPSSSLEKGAGG